RTNISSRMTFELSLAHLFRITDDAAFTAAVWQIDDARLQRHPHRQCDDFITIDIRMESDTALCRSRSVAVLGAVSGKYFYRAVVHTYRYADSKYSGWFFYQIEHPFIIPKHIQCFM